MKMNPVGINFGMMTTELQNDRKGDKNSPNKCCSDNYALVDGDEYILAGKKGKFIKAQVLGNIHEDFKKAPKAKALYQQIAREKFETLCELAGRIREAQNKRNEELGLEPDKKKTSCKGCVRK